MTEFSWIFGSTGLYTGSAARLKPRMLAAMARTWHALVCNEGRPLDGVK